MATTGFCVATPFAVSVARGEDARAFLNGQLSSDVKTLAVGRWQLSSYSTPKGRALATFALAVIAEPCSAGLATATAAPPAAALAPSPASDGVGEAFWLVTRRGVAEATFKRLAMFVLRSKVRWVHDSHVLVGVCGVAGRPALADLLGCEPPLASECVAAMAGSAASAPATLAVGLGDDAWWLLLPAASVSAVAARLRAALPEIDAAAWDAVEVAAGRPWVEAATREAFVPQMLNLDLTGGISFRKGCYPGQEIVARTQYLGKVKRRMLRFAVALGADECLPPAGAPIHVATAAVAAAADAAAGEAPGQALGQVVLAAPLDAGRAQLLAVLQMDLAAGADLRLGGPLGPALEPLPLPYPLEAD